MGRRYTYSDNSKRFPESKSLNKRLIETGNIEAIKEIYEAKQYDL